MGLFDAFDVSPGQQDPGIDIAGIDIGLNDAMYIPGPHTDGVFTEGGPQAFGNRGHHPKVDKGDLKLFS